MGTKNAVQHISGWQTALLTSALMILSTAPARAIECVGSLTSGDLIASLLAERPTYYTAIPVTLRFVLDDSATQEIGCDIYRAADGMEGALCITVATASASDARPYVQQPAGSYGDNAVDRILRLPLNPTDETITCQLAKQLLAEASAPPFSPVETNPKNGRVCLRDVMRSPDTLTVANAAIRDAAGTEYSTGPLNNDGNGCFGLDNSYPPGSFEVTSFEVDTFDAGSIELGRVADFVQPDGVDTPRNGIWFISLGSPDIGNGGLDTPYNSIAAFNSAQGRTGGPQPGDFIYVIQGGPDDFTAPIELLDEQWLVGRGEGLLDALAAYGVVPRDNSPLNNSIYTQAGDHSELNGYERSPIVLARNNTLSGLFLNTAFSPALVADDLGSLTVRNTTILANNGGIAVLANMDIDVELEEVFAGGGFSVNALDLQNTTGRLRIDGGELLAVPGTARANLGRGVSLVGAENIAINDVKIDGSVFGVYGRDVKNFSLTNSTVTSGLISNTAPVAGIDFENLTGDVLFTSVQVSTGVDANLRIHNSEGILKAELRDLMLGQEDADTQTSISIGGYDTAAMTVSLSDSELHGAQNRAVECIVEGAANLSCLLVDNNIFQTTNSAFSKFYGEQPLMFRSVAGESSAAANFVMNYSVSATPGRTHTVNNSLRGAIAADFQAGRGVVNGVISDMIFGTEGDPLSGALFGNAIEITTSAAVSHNLLLTDTKIFGAFNDGALRILGAGPTKTTIRNLQFFGDDADLLIQLSDTASSAQGSDMTHCLDIADSTLISWDSPRYFALSQRSSMAGRIRLPGYQGSPNGEDTTGGGSASADVKTYLKARNVRLVSFNPAMEPIAIASNVLNLLGSPESCAPMPP